MADMKPVDRGAGSRRVFVARAAALAAGIAIGACGGGAVRRAPSDAWLEPLYGFSGATLTNKVDPTGLPLPGGSEISISFMFPVAVVSCLGAIFVADAGHGRLFRYERSTGLMAAVTGVHIAMGSKLDAGADGTLYLMDAMGGEISRISMHGAALPTMHGRLPTNRYLDFAVEPYTGRVFAVDAVHNVLDRIEPLGRVALPFLEIDMGGPIALDGDALLIADTRCSCVNEWRNGRLARRLAAGSLRLPKMLRTERGEVYLLDGFDGGISRVHEGGLETLLPRQLNMVSPQHIFVSNGIMYVADGAGRSVAAFRIHRRLP